MNPDPILIIRNTFYLLLPAFTISALIKSENTKKKFIFCNYKQQQKTSLLSALVYILDLLYFMAFYFLLFIIISFY
jgi:hypothetical protein